MTEKTIYALGFFDGVHRGHRALLAACRRLADETGCKSAAVTFSAHPDTLVLGKTPPLINTVADRMRLLREAGMDDVVVLPFDKKMQTMPWQDFLTLLGESYHAQGLVCGHDFRFGDRGQGDANLLQAYCLEKGLVEEANQFLGHPHILTGTVISGRKLGRTLGIPTANLALPEGIAPLPHGVYACKAVVEGQTYLAGTNIGNRPTVGGHHTTVEPWLLDFTGDLYGKDLRLSFHAFLRGEVKFPTLAALKEEIIKNAGETRDFFENSTK